MRHEAAAYTATRSIVHWRVGVLPRRGGLLRTLAEARPAPRRFGRRGERRGVEPGQPVLHEFVLEAALLGDQIPARRLGGLLVDAATLGIEPREPNLRQRIVRIGGLVEPAGGDRLVLLHAAAVEQEDPVFDLRADMAVARGLAEPARRQRLVGDDAHPLDVEPASEYCASMSPRRAARRR